MWLGTSSEIGESSTLQTRLDQPFPHATDEAPFEEAEDIRVRIRGAMIAENKDKWPWGSGRNDLLITTNYAFGDDPIVDRVHYLGINDELGWYGDFFDDVIVSTRDLQNRRLRLNVRVYDIDGLSKEDIEVINQLSETAVMSFPLLRPYAGPAMLATEMLVNLVNQFDKHDKIIDQTITLEMQEPNTGHRLLQPGYFVCTGEDRREKDEDISINHDLKLINEDGSKYEYYSYVVLHIDKNCEARRQREIDQKVAKLIAQLNGKGRSTETDLHYLRKTLDAYTRIQKLNRIRELNEKSDRTEAEERVLQKLQSEEVLKPYLPNQPDE